jgi:hypothetical protein
MNSRRLYIVVLLISPLVGLYLNGFVASLVLVTTSAITLYTMRRQGSQDREIVYLFVILNQLMFMYCWYHADGQLVISVPDSHLEVSEENLVQSKPFVSVVLVDGMTNGTVSDDYSGTVEMLQRTSSPVLTREIVAPLYSSSTSQFSIPIVHSLSDSSDMIIFVSCKATFTDDWMVGIVRELFAHSEQMIVPTIFLSPESPLTGGAMLSSESGLWVMTNPRELDRDLPLIPVHTALGISRSILDKIGFQRFVQLLSQNRLLELSLLAWFCHSGIRNTSYSKMIMRDKSSIPQHDWKSVEGETVEETVIASCQSNRNMEWFYDKFVKYDAEAKVRVFRVEIGVREQDGSRTCLVANYNNSLGTQKCERDNRQMLFTVMEDPSPNIRSVLLHNTCLDANSADKPGSKPILYTCTERNRNQMFYFDNLRIRWGSFCLSDNSSGEIVLEVCNDLENQIFRAEYS